MSEWLVNFCAGRILLHLGCLVAIPFHRTGSGRALWRMHCQGILRELRS